jgi:uncharacterized protein (DUF1499 family)
MEAVMKKKIIIAIIVVVGLLAGLLLTARTLYPTNIADTAPNHAEEKLRTRRYQADLKTFAAETEKIVPTISSWGSNWKYVGTETGETSVIIKAEVPVVVFTDDLQIKAERDSAGGGIIVDVHSNSRVGKSDFGENRRHVLRILEALDAKFAK